MRQQEAKLQTVRCICKDRTHRRRLPVSVQEEAQAAEEVHRVGRPLTVDWGAAVVVEAVQHEELLEEAEECHAV